jgi:hypothetical protein
MTVAAIIQIRCQAACMPCFLSFKRAGEVEA